VGVYGMIVKLIVGPAGINSVVLVAVCVGVGLDARSCDTLTITYPTQ